MNKPKRIKNNENIRESLMGVLSGVGNQLSETAKKPAVLDNWDEILGFTDPKEKQHHAKGDLFEGQELNLKELHEGEEKEESKEHIEPGIDYAREIVHSGERALASENREIDQKLKEIADEIKKLADSSKELQTQFKDVAVEQHVVKPGKYHKTFFEWLLNVVQAARMKVEDSGAWLSAMQSKKKDQQYGAMAKKHGTSFTLSNERVVATQVG